jgi:hypothetical protein
MTAYAPNLRTKITAPPRASKKWPAWAEEWEIDETTSSANCGSLVQVDALGANVALAWPVRVPDVRAAVSSLLGAASNGYVASDGFAARSRGARRLDHGN